jgi:hypothetical protein
MAERFSVAVFREEVGRSGIAQRKTNRGVFFLRGTNVEDVERSEAGQYSPAHVVPKGLSRKHLVQPTSTNHLFERAKSPAHIDETSVPVDVLMWLKGSYRVSTI